MEAITRRLVTILASLALLLGSLGGLGGGGAQTTARAEGGGLQVVGTISMSAPPVAAVVNPWTHRLYVLVNAFSSHIEVVDTVTNRIVGTLNGIYLQGGPFSLALNPRTHRLYVAEDYHVDVIDTDSNTEVDQINTTSATGVWSAPVVAVNPTTNRLYTVANDAQLPGVWDTLLTIDGATDTIIATTTVSGGSIGALVVDALHGRVVTLTGCCGTPVLSVLSGDPLAVTFQGTLPGASLGGLALNPRTATGYAAVAPPGTGAEVAVAIVPTTVVAAIPLLPVALDAQAVTLATNRTANRLYALQQDTTTATTALVAMDGATNTRTAVLPIAGRVNSMAVDQQTGLLYVADSRENQVLVVQDSH